MYLQVQVMLKFNDVVTNNCQSFDVDKLTKMKVINWYLA